ncbi:MAG: phospholipase D-like domain-containing protein [Candidatus Marsarchaeota archaeon]|nr:phospholipase D-like domain-containing protein [Candidatus Marsarchaeota archaeon]
MEQLEELAGIVRVPECDLVCSYAAGVPVYRTRLRASVRRQQHIPTIPEFVLRLISAGIGSTDIPKAIGLGADFVRTALGYLLQEDLIVASNAISESGDQCLSVTPRGRSALEKALASVTSEYMDVLVDGLTGQYYSPDTASIADGRILRKETDCWLLQPLGRMRPTPRALNDGLPRLQRILREQTSQLSRIAMAAAGGGAVDGEPEGKTDLIEIADIVDHRLLYKRANVLVFRNRDTGEVEFRVFEGQFAMPDYDEVMTKLAREGRGNIIPPGLLHKPEEIEQPVLSKNVADEVERVAKLSLEIRKVEDTMSVLQTAAETAASSDNRELPVEIVTEKTLRIRELESQLGAHLDDKKALEERIAEMARQKEDLKKQLGASRPVFDNEHRTLLKRALTSAKDSVIIISPWIKRAAVDKEIITMIRKCLARQVRVVVGYGMEKRANQEFIDYDVQADFEAIQKSGNGHLLYVEEIGKTHEKVVICDDVFCVIGSFNFLSYKGDRGFRQETGMYSESAEHIRVLKERVLGSFAGLPKY